MRIADLNWMFQIFFNRCLLICFHCPGKIWELQILYLWLFRDDIIIIIFSLYLYALAVSPSLEGSQQHRENNKTMFHSVFLVIVLLLTLATFSLTLPFIYFSETYFQPVVTFFLFSFGDYLGRQSSGFVMWVSHEAMLSAGWNSIFPFLCCLFL